jgi:hypothetical protein
MGFEDNWNPEADGSMYVAVAAKHIPDLGVPDNVAQLMAVAAAPYTQSNGIDLLEKRLQQVTPHTSHLTPHTSHLAMQVRSKRAHITSASDETLTPEFLSHVTTELMNASLLGSQTSQSATKQAEAASQLELAPILFRTGATPVTSGQSIPPPPGEGLSFSSAAPRARHMKRRAEVFVCRTMKGACCCCM